MATLTLTAQPRGILGKKVARLRRAGITPANIYGHNVPSQAIQTSTHDLDLLLRRAGRTSLINLTVDGEREPRAVLVRAVSRRPTTGQLLHVDFMQVSMREKLTVTVPLVLTGHAPVTDTQNVTILQSLESIQIECLPGDIPSQLDVDLATLTDTTSSIHVRDLVTPPNTTILNDPDTSVVVVSLRARTEEEIEAAEVPAAEDVPTVDDGRQPEAEEE